MPVPTRLKMGPSNIGPNRIVGPTKVVDDFRLKLKAMSRPKKKGHLLQVMATACGQVQCLGPLQQVHAFILAAFFAFLSHGGLLS